TVLLRLTTFTHSTGWGRFGPGLLVKMVLHHYSIRYGICISRHAHIGSGLYIGHFGGIVVHPYAVIGNNCNLSQGVTIGQVNRGPSAGCPVIGDNVYIGAGAKIIGCIHVGNGAAVGANAAVVADVPTGAAVGGVPARILSDKGSEGYVNRTDYPPVPAE
ncbi:MAG TPA: hypothetical protein VGO53_12785, partial [Steroidobacteraceae bacterium]|nr:hypothetical protein [Steroidobacteraceae bacterium]